MHEEDREEWLGFLGLLKKHRARAPINGFIVTVSIGELMGNSPSFAIDLAKSLRQRVQELTEKLEVFAPVYVLFTKVDLIPGFHEFFLDLDWNERDRVWGATIPYDQSNGSELITLFDRHFDGRVAMADAEAVGAYRNLSIQEMAEFTRMNRHLPTMKGRDAWEREHGFSFGDLTNQLANSSKQSDAQKGKKVPGPIFY